MEIDEFKVYQKAMEVAEKCWNHVIGWDYFSKDTVGKQLIRAVDSIAANLSEGFWKVSLQGSEELRILFKLYDSPALAGRMTIV